MLHTLADYNGTSQTPPPPPLPDCKNKARVLESVLSHASRVVFHLTGSEISRVWTAKTW